MTESPIDLATREHLDRHLGTPTEIIHFTAGVIHIRKYDHVPARGMTTYATAGLSSIRLDGDVAAVPPIPERQEFTMTVNRRDADEHIPWILFAAAASVGLRGNPALWGEVLDLPKLPGWKKPFAGLWCTGQQLFPDAMAFEPGFKTWIGWLIPVHAQEIAFIQREGWRAFETIFASKDADFLSLRRASIV